MKSKLTDLEARAIRQKAAGAGLSSGMQQVAVNVGDYSGRAAAEQYIVKVKAASSNPRPLVTHALSLMEKLGDRMDGQAYQTLMEPIIRQLEDAVRTLDQAMTTGSHQAAVATKAPTKSAQIPFDQLLMGCAQAQAAEAAMVMSLDPRAHLRR